MDSGADSTSSSSRSDGGSHPNDTDAGASGSAGGTQAGGAGGGTTCSPTRAVATRRGLNLLLLVDDSLSVVLQPAWTSLTTAISAFVGDANNTGLGLGIEYYGTSCNAADYQIPAVGIADLPGNATKINASYPLPISGKAIVAAMTGATAYVRSVIDVDKERDAALVLVTDGVLDPLCGGSVTAASAEAAVALSGTPSVQTFVIALGAGPTLINPTGSLDVTPLDDVATAGGTSRATRVEVNLTSNVALTAALASVTAEARPCAFLTPTGLSSNQTALEFVPAPGSAAIKWPRVASAAACGSSSGVYASSHTGYLELCPAACTTLNRYPDGVATAVKPCAVAK
jgi:hypothetical protein